MEVIYSKYSRERDPKYQIRTKIVRDKDGEMYVSKTALTVQAEDHIKQIHSNYALLQTIYKYNQLVVPVDYNKGYVLFEYLQGKSIDQLMLEAAIKKDESRVYELLDMYKWFLETLAEGDYCDFNYTAGFIEMFGKHDNLLGLNSFTISNIDLNLDNILQGEDGRLKVIDYEWVYCFPIPVNFIKFRAINSYYYSHYGSMRNFIPIEDMFSYVGILESEISDYIEMANIFADLVGTEREKHILRKYLKPAVPFNFIEPEEYKAQIFISETQEFTEDNSMHFNFGELTQSIIFDLSKSGEIKNIRFDPREDKGIVLIKDVKLIDLENNIGIINKYSSNVDWIEGDYYAFLNDDPQIYYEVPLKKYKSIQFTIMYFEKKHEDLLSDAHKRITSLKEQIFNSLRNFPFQSESIKELNKENIEISKLISEVDFELKSLSGLLCDKENEVQALTQKMDGSNQKMSSLQQEFELLQIHIKEQSLLLERRERTINEMVSTNWWKMRLFYKRIISRKK